MVKSGATKAARYCLPDNAPEARRYARQVTLTGLEESRVYDQFRTVLNLHTGLRANAESIVGYAFTEAE